MSRRCSLRVQARPMWRWVRAIWLIKTRWSSLSLFSPVRRAQRPVRYCAGVIEARPRPVMAWEYTASRALLAHRMMWNGS